MKYLPLLLLLIPTLAFADTSFVPLTNTPFIERAGNAVDLRNMLDQLYRLCIGVAAVVAVLQIMRAGVMYMGGDSVTEKKEAKNLIALSIGGIILVLSPFIVFSVINPDILSLKIDGIEKLRSTEVSTSTPTATTTLVLPGTEQASCSITYVEIRRSEPNTSCSTLGSDWETASQSCCLVVNGGFCCGRKPQAPEPPQTGAGFRYRIAYQDIDSMNPDILKQGRQCVSYEAETLSTQEACVFAEVAAGDLLTRRGKEFQYIKRCSNNEMARHRFSNLPTCGQ